MIAPNERDDHAPVDGSGSVQRPTKVAERVARIILRDIVASDLPPGAKLLAEANMLRRFEVSRASLREALRLLEMYGLITIKPGPGGGPVVARVDSLDFARSTTFFFHSVGATLGELVEARLYIEPVSARLAATRLTDESAAQLRALLERESAHADTELSSPASHADLFHNRVAGLSNNRVLGLMSQSVIDIFVERIHPVFPKEEWDSLRSIHQRIGAAILDRDGDLAEKLMREHLETLVNSVSALFPYTLSEVIDWR
jgi:GntR family transcriptional repressor for pyruvate dehydrogenase complex